jgi:hypothetical protein
MDDQAIGKGRELERKDEEPQGGRETTYQYKPKRPPEKSRETEICVPHPDDTLRKLGVKRISQRSGRQEIGRLNRMCSIESEDYLTDYGNQKKQWSDFWLCEPKTEEEAVLCLERASELGIRTTIRGSGHSMNGSSLPKTEGLLLLTTGLNRVVICPTGEIDVGAGAQVLVVDEYIQKFGLRLPVVNDGGQPAPTVGGFICAGGFGVSSKAYGGFWNHVNTVRFWERNKGVRTIGKDQDSFWKLCGCGKPDGMILSAKLRTLGRYKGGGNEDRIDFRYVEHPRRIWFTFLAPVKKTSLLRRAVIRLDRDLKEYWLGLPPYEYLILENGSQIPFCFFPNYKGSLVAIGIWGEVSGKTEGDLRAIIERVSEFTEKATYARRYWQSELCTHTPYGGASSIRSMDGER